MRRSLLMLSLPAVLLAAFPALADKCPAVEKITYMPVKDEAGLDPVYDRLRLDQSCEVELLAALTDTRPMPDPRREPTRSNRFVIADAAFFVLWDKYQWPAGQFLPPNYAKKYKQEGVYAYFDYVADPANRTQLAARATALTKKANLPHMVHLAILPNGHVRLDGGPELDEAQLRAAIQAMKAKDSPPDISFTPNAFTKYDDVARILKIFQEEHYGNKLGFTGLQQPDP